MDKIKSQIIAAQRRMLMAQFFKSLTWAVVIGLAVAALAILVPKLTPVSGLSDPERAQQWDWGWIIVGSVGAVIGAVVWTWMRRPTFLTAAIEIDSRFELRERVSSACSIPKPDQNHLAAQALIQDASRRVDNVEIKTGFSLGLGWKNLLPVLPIALVAGLMLGLSNRQPAVEESVEANLAAYRERLEESRTELAKKIEEQIELAQEEELEEAEVFLKQLRDQLIRDEQAPPLSKDEALAEFNEIKQQLDEQAERLGKPEELRRQFARMAPSSQGPAEAVNEALRDGDTEQAETEFQQLADQVEQGQLAPQDEQQLAEQLESMESDLRDAVAEHEEREQDLKDQLQQAKQEGDQEKQDELEEKIEEHQDEQPQMEQLEELADSLAEAKEKLQEANDSESPSNGETPNAPRDQPLGIEAAEALRKAADQANQMSQDQKQSDALQELADQVGESKAQLSENAESEPGEGSEPGEQGESGDSPNQESGEQEGSEGEGAQPSESGSQDGAAQQGGSTSGENSANGSQSQNGTQGNNQSGEPGSGNSAGQGRGARGEAAEETEFQDERVQGNLQEGASVTSDIENDDLNDPGVARSRIVEQVKSNLEAKSDPTVEQRLSRRQKDHAREYFKQFSKQNNSKE